MAEEEEDDEIACRGETIEEMWPMVPTELHRKILTSISLKTIFHLRCVNKFFNNVMFRNEAFHSFGAAAMSQKPAFYFKNINTKILPLSVDWYTFDLTTNLWQRMKQFVTTKEKEKEKEVPLKHLHRFSNHLINQFVFPVDGLLCILHESLRELPDEESNPVKYTQTLFPFLVWNPLTNQYKELPPNKHNIRKNYTSSDSAFIHAFRDDKKNSYKILCSLKDYTSTGAEKPMTTEVYDSRTGNWTEWKTYERMGSSFGSGNGVYVNGVVYFQLWRPRSWILFCFDVGKGEWREEGSEQRALKLFEWNGSLMTTLPPLDSWNKYEKSLVLKRIEKGWVDVGICVPSEVRREFSRGEEIVACEKLLCLSGYDRHGKFKTAVYDQEHNLWKPASSSNNHLSPCDEVRFVFRYTPSFTALP